MNYSSDNILSGLPAESQIQQGLIDLAQGLNTVASCLVRIASPRLVSAQLLEEGDVTDPQNAELDLYRILESEGDQAYSLYQSYLRELVSFEHVLDQRLRLAS
jgi:hypothetical protein